MRELNKFTTHFNRIYVLYANSIRKDNIPNWNGRSNWNGGVGGGLFGADSIRYWKWISNEFKSMKLQFISGTEDIVGDIR